MVVVVGGVVCMEIVVLVALLLGILLVSSDGRGLELGCGLGVVVWLALLVGSVLVANDGDGLCNGDLLCDIEGKGVTLG